MLAVMTAPNSLHDLLLNLRTPAVRDLAWALLSPPLLGETTKIQRHPLQASRWSRQPQCLADWLMQQERDASEMCIRDRRRTGLRDLISIETHSVDRSFFRAIP